MSFVKYLREQEELEQSMIELGKKNKIVDLIKTMEDLNDEKFKNFAVNELGLSPDESDTIIYKMLRDYILASDNTSNSGDDGVEDVIDDISTTIYDDEDGEDMGDCEDCDDMDDYI